MTTSPTTEMPYITFLTQLGQKLQQALTAISQMADATVERDLENPFFDGILTEKLRTLLEQLASTGELLTEITANAIEQKLDDEMCTAVVTAEAHLRDVMSGKVFQTEPLASTPAMTPAT